jgi:hypothetical protein
MLVPYSSVSLRPVPKEAQDEDAMKEAVLFLLGASFWLLWTVGACPVGKTKGDDGFLFLYGWN